MDGRFNFVEGLGVENLGRKLVDGLVEFADGFTRLAGGIAEIKGIHPVHPIA